MRAIFALSPKITLADLRLVTYMNYVEWSIVARSYSREVGLGIWTGWSFKKTLLRRSVFFFKENRSLETKYWIL